jgi:hypothetical protein
MDGYPIMMIMISLGNYLRLYSLLPKPLLAATYIGVGGGIFFSSLFYYQRPMKSMQYI